MFPYRLHSIAGELTLSSICDQALREDAADLVYVHARENIESHQFSTLQGTALDITVNELKVPRPPLADHHSSLPPLPTNCHFSISGRA